MRLVGRHRSWGRGPRRVAVPATVGAVLLAAAVTVVVQPGAVAGVPSAVASVAPPQRALVNVAPAPLPTPSTPAPPAATPPPAAPPPAAPPPAQSQPRNTVRLAHGGMATLEPKEVVNGVLPVPEGVRQAAWWGAPLDGQTGATVLAGHVNWKGQTGPFAELWNAKVGDVVTVVDANNQTYTYRVRELVTVHKNDLPARAQDLFGQDGAHRLVLVTCGGRWVGGHDGYEENRVVIADPA